MDTGDGKPATVEPTHVVLFGSYDDDGAFEAGDVIHGSKDECEELFQWDGIEDEWPIIILAEIKKTSFATEGAPDVHV